MPTLPPEPTTLTVEQWKKLPTQERYDGATLERLRMSDPKFKSEREWQRFKQKLLSEDVKEGNRGEAS